MDWTFCDEQPIYAQLKRQLSEAIVTGAYAPGERLPSVRDIALDAGVNPNTVQRSLADLEREGLVFSQRTTGRFVTEDQQLLRTVRHSMAQEKATTFLLAMRQIGCDRQEAIDLLRQMKEEEIQ